jgi:hypothetical protein
LAGLAVIAVVGLWMALTYLLGKGGAENHENRDEPGFHVEFKWAFINTSQRLDVAPFWIAYGTSAGDTISPIALVSFLEVTNASSHETSVSRWAMELQTDRCQDWIPLPSIDPAMGHILWGINAAQTTDFHDMKLLDITSFNRIWSYPIPGFRSQQGLLMFDTSAKCDNDFGDHVRFRLTLTDSLGKSWPYTSPDFVILRRSALDRGAGESHYPLLRPTGDADASPAQRKLFSARLPFLLPRNKGVIATIPKTYDQIIIDELGVYMCGCTRVSEK